MNRRKRNSVAAAALLAVLAATIALIIAWPRLQRRAETAALLDGVQDHEEMLLRDAAEMDASVPNWKTAEGIHDTLRKHLFAVTAGIDSYKKAVDALNARTGQNAEYSPKVVALEKSVAEIRKRAAANKAFEDIGAGAPNPQR